MTSEQIIQNAEICVFTENSFRKEHKKLILTPSEEKIAKDFYIAGAHSRDEEIKELKEEIESLQEQYNTCFDGFKKRGTKLGELMKENVKLSNPWISVKVRLPEENGKVIVYYGKDTEVVWYKNGEFICVIPTQTHIVGYKRVLTESGVHTEPMYGSPERERITNMVTHWMPIPPIEKEGKE